MLFKQGRTITVLPYPPFHLLKFYFLFFNQTCPTSSFPSVPERADRQMQFAIKYFV